MTFSYFMIFYKFIEASVHLPKATSSYVLQNIANKFSLYQVANDLTKRKFFLASKIFKK